jgi:hypothetical protein
MQSSPPPTHDPSPAIPETLTVNSDGEVIDVQPATDSLPAVVSQTGLPSLPTPDTDGFAETVPFRALDLRINRKAGEFVLDGDPNPRKQVVLIPRGCHRAQMFYGLPYKPGEPHVPSCQSPDAKIAYGWIEPRDQTDTARKCASCPKKGFGSGYCTDLMVMLAFDLEKDSPVITRFQNAEINPRKGAFTLAVNRFRSMGLQPIQTALTMSFRDIPGTDYKELVFDVAACPLPEDTIEMMDVCWTAYEESRGYDVQNLMDEYARAS